MDDVVKQNIIKVVVVVIMFILLLCTITANSKYGKLEKEVDGYKYEISILEEDKKEKENLIESYKKTQKEDKETISKHLETIAGLENKISSKDTQIKQLNTKIKEFEKQTNELSEQITSLQKNLKDKNDTVTLLNDSVNDLNTKLTTTTNQVNNLTATNNTLNNKLDKVEKKFETLNNYYLVNSEIELLDALKKGGNIIINSDILMSNNIEIDDKYVSIDLKGKNLVVLGIELNSSNIEIKDSSLTPGKLSLGGNGIDVTVGFKVNEGSVLKLTNGNYFGKGLFEVKNNGSLFVIDGNFDETREEIIIERDNAKVQVLGGTFN